jgi:hypothetical protein
LIDHALVISGVRDQDDTLDSHLGSGEEVIDVPVLSATAVNVAEDAGRQAAGGPTGVDVLAGWERKAP